MSRDKRQRAFKGSIVLVLIGVGLTVAGAPARAQPYPVPATWGGDLSSRPRLTGDWGGVRDELGKKGVVLDVDFVSTPAYVVTGGRSTGYDAWSNAYYTLNVDTQKLGWWPGGFLKVEGNTGFGTNVDKKAGTIVPVNTAALLPAQNETASALTNATFMQFLSEKFGLLIGKINTLEASPQEFYGNYNTQFLNAAFNFPMTLAQVPLSAYGGGVIALPTKNSVLSLIALDPNGKATSNSFDNVFNNGVMLVGSGQLTIKPFDLVGHQNLGFSWSNKERFSLEQDPSNIARLLLQAQFPGLADPGPVLEEILARYFPGLIVPAQPANRASSTWSVSYGFDQYLWQPAGDAKHGIGVFLSVGAADGNPNPIKWAFMGGIGGKGVGSSRPDDSYGLGFARTQFSGAFVPLLRDNLNLGLNYEGAVEMYYNAAITGWLDATADLQIINPGLKKTLNSSQPPGLTNVDTAVVAGIRFRVRF
jgi:porin